MNDVSNWSKAMGLELVSASKDEVIAELEIGPVHLTRAGIVHGGVHAGIIESTASIGASLSAKERGQIVAGLENSTSFVRAAKSGRIRVTATPVTRGRTTQLWEATVRDSEQRVLATGRVRLICLDAAAELG